MNRNDSNVAKAARGMNFDEALTRMRDWAHAIEDWVQATDDLIAAYEAAIWLIIIARSAVALIRRSGAIEVF